VLAPVITALLYLVVFAQLLEGRLEVYPGISYATFLLPGLIMMSVIQNAFSNSSSSLIQSKNNGNIVFVLLSPLSTLEFFVAFVAAAVVRGLMVGLALYVFAWWMIDLPIYNLLYVMGFSVLGSAVMGALGLIAAIWADSYDKLSAFQNFLILPLSFLSGVFYSIHSLPAVWQTASRFNPFFYMIDGVRYGFLGVSDISPVYSVLIMSLFLLICAGISLILLARGYKLRR